MSRKHYQAIASALSNARAFMPDPAWRALCDSIILTLKSANPSFSPAKFREALFKETV